MKQLQTDTYLLGKACEVAAESNCRRRKVGAVVVRDDAILVTACNGTPPGITPCNEGGCERCLSDIPSGESYDACLCQHAEQRAIANAARTGKSLDGSVLYCTLRPCVHCINICVAAGIKSIVYEDDIAFPKDVEDAYQILVGSGVIQVTRMVPSNSDVPNSSTGRNSHAIVE
jgi:dCMP deaminase